MPVRQRPCSHGCSSPAESGPWRWRGILSLSETQASQKNKLILSLNCAVFEIGREILLEMTRWMAPAGEQFPANPDLGRLS